MAEEIGLWLYLSIFVVPLVIGYFAPNYKLAIVYGAAYVLGTRLVTITITGSFLPPEISTADWASSFGMSPGQRMDSWIVGTLFRTLFGAFWGTVGHFSGLKFRKIKDT